MTKIAKLVVLNECQIRIDGLDLITRKDCVGVLKYFLPNAKYTPAYKLGRWDGTQSFMTLGGRTYLNLLDKILPKIKENGIKA